MSQNDNNTDQKKSESHALVKSDNNSHALTVKGKGSLLALTDSILSSAIAARRANQLAVDDSWINKIWAWADEFELPEELIPRSKEELIALEKLNIEMCRPKDLEKLILEKTEIEEKEIEEKEKANSRRRETEIKKNIFVGLSVFDTQYCPQEISLSDRIIHLRKLEATTNKMNYIPIELVHLKNLVEITFSGMESTNLLKNIRSFDNLTKLNIRNCNTDGLFESVFQISHLMELSIQSSIIGILPDSICQFSKLTTLDISHNKISKLPDNINQLSNLIILNIAYNEITELPDSICQFSKLTTLNISNNKISHLPENIGQLTSLQTFFAHSNQRLCNIPVSMAKLSNLTTFDVSSTIITEIPKSMKDNSKLSVNYINNFPF